MTDSTAQAARDRMVDQQIAARGVQDTLVLNAMRTVPREMFVPGDVRDLAWEDRPLPIGQDQTISQPYVVACMVEALRLQGGETVLEVGTGSGYATAILAAIAGRVCSLERIRSLANRARTTLHALNCSNVSVHHGDGTLGWPDQAPWDAILVSAGGPEVPEALKSQLKVGGRLVIPIGSSQRNQQLVQITKRSESQFDATEIASVRFVPLIGEAGWAADETTE